MRYRIQRLRPWRQRSIQSRSRGRVLKLIDDSELDTALQEFQDGLDAQEHSRLQ